MKYFFIYFLQLILVQSASAQLNDLSPEKLKADMANAREDTIRALIMANLAETYRSSNPDSAIFYAQQSIALSRRIKYPRGEAKALLSVSVVQRELGNLPLALELSLKGLRIARDNNYYREQILGYLRVGNVYMAVRNFEKAISLFLLAEKISLTKSENYVVGIVRIIIAEGYLLMGKVDSAQYYANQVDCEVNNPSICFRIQGDIQMKLKKNAEALNYYRLGISKSVDRVDYRTASDINIHLAAFYQSIGQIDSALNYAKKGLALAKQLSYKNRIMTASLILAELYEDKDPRESIRYYKMFSAARDSLYSAEKMNSLQTMISDEQERENEIQTAKTAYTNKIRQFLFIGGLLITILIAVFLFRNNKQKQKANDHLRATQAQLIQSEKMASLGELTAGIAHEIQNPLNFVNNFSEVNTELMSELKNEVVSGNKENAANIADDISANLEKIVFHGKRADAIVKSMLLHSRSGSGKKELTDINNMVDEYLRLSFHGMRAKEKSFNAAMQTDYDPLAGSIEIMPQEIGRVLLNLFNNSFYSMFKKKENEKVNYEPVLKVSTSKKTGSIEIRVTDNGLGIPKEVIEKVFQPFFTTKPTGEGTGLGLSLSYDIIKAHGGELTVSTKEGEYAEFKITIPI